MKEYAVYYKGTEDGEILTMVGEGHGKNKEEAIQDFLFWHDGVSRKDITSVEFYK